MTATARDPDTDLGGPRRPQSECRAGDEQPLVVRESDPSDSEGTCGRRVEGGDRTAGAEKRGDLKMAATALQRSLQRPRHLSVCRARNHGPGPDACGRGARVWR